MTRHVLAPHPQTLSGAVSGIEVWVGRTGGTLRLTYVVAGPVGEIVVPRVARAGRTDGLWRTTCFEAFVRPDGGEAYLELNFAPSGAWAAYRFERYREEMEAAEVAAPAIETLAGADRLEAHMTALLPEDFAGPARLGLSAVIEEKSGAKSYWALAHPPGRPDFHHAAAFAVPLTG